MVPSDALSIIAVALGIINGAVIVNYSVLLNEYLGIEKLPMTMGFSTCMVGMSAFLRPVIIGKLKAIKYNYHEESQGVSKGGSFPLHEFQNVNQIFVFLTI